ncbi:MAG: cardiolipin synthase [Rhodocyclaceae bacterium]|nr:cardiolipin synthase [Rhodocyclaceae bacterium]
MNLSLPAWLADENNWLLLASLSIYALALMSAVRAIMVTRTAQGAMGWVIALLALPIVTLPLYWVFGRTRFEGYTSRRATITARARAELEPLWQLPAREEPPTAALRGLHGMAHQLSGAGFLGGNEIRLLVGGVATFDAILDAIGAARRYILVQYYIFNADEIGGRIAEALMDRARAGVRVSFMYDPIGSSLPRRFLARMQAAGIECSQFDTTRGRGNRFRINFRNHRKIVVVDGDVAFLGGVNVCDDYYGKAGKGVWRDAHVRVRGPAAMIAAATFIKDWYWARRQLPRMDFDLPERQGDARVLLWATGPADEQPECTVSLLSSFNAARQRIWIANPYFVPTEPVLQALRLAILRGVDVRIVVPFRADHKIVRLASQMYQADIVRTGGRVFRYRQGMIHTKAFVVDDVLASVGSVNLDHRSILINFEIAAYSDEPAFIAAVEAMLAEDMRNSREVSLETVNRRSFINRLATRSANLLAPIL